MITRNYKNILKDILQNTGRYPVEGGAYGAYLLKTPTNESVYTTQQPPQLPEYPTKVAKDNTSGGVVIGSGSTPAQESDYWLSNQITSGFDGYVSDAHQTDNDGNHGIVLSVIITNTGSSNLTIGEVGYSLRVLSSVHEGGDSSYASMLRNVLIDRTVLDSPITIGAGQAAIIDYVLKTVDLFGGSTALGTKTITQNGTYNAGTDGLDGYSIVEVNVSGGGATVEPLSVAQNGTYTAPSGKAYSPVAVNVIPNLQSKTVTQNGTVTPDQGYDGLSSVVVNVSGGGGSNVFFGAGVPEANLGTNGDYYIRDGEIQSKFIRIDITKAARGDITNFGYYGSRAISIVCKDDADNEVEISPYIVDQYYWNGSSLIPHGTNRGVFRANIGSYLENNGLPGHYAACYDIPNSYRIYKIKLTRRNSAQYPDYWVSFDVYQCDSEGNNLSLLLSEQNLTEADWNDWDSFTEFSPTGQLVDINELHEVYEKQNDVWGAI